MVINISKIKLDEMPKCFIKFKHTDLGKLKDRLLTDLSREYFAVLFGKLEEIDGLKIINVYDLIFPFYTEYDNQSSTFLHLKKDFVYKVLVELTNRLDVNTIIDVHTHPFARSKVSFSIIDDRDERDFFNFINEKFDLNYASIVLSETEYSARIWSSNSDNKKVTLSTQALIKTQTRLENILSSDFIKNVEKEGIDVLKDTDSFFNRGVLVIGLDVMRQILDNQVISIVGIGGLGSIIAEHLVHMGFHNINLIDPDIIEISNLNRIVGAYYNDAERHEYKVNAVKKHLESINPAAIIMAYKNDIYDHQMERVIALSDWIFVTTDNHSSRLRCQKLSIKYFVPLISVGVNITVKNDKIEDVSGEIIIARLGDNLCLNCLHRINPINVANETHPDKNIRDELIKRGYVPNKHIKEPAVKTLNSLLSTLAVEILINQYTERQKHVPILVYENNIQPMIYEDKESVNSRNKNCFICNI